MFNTIKPAAIALAGVLAFGAAEAKELNFGIISTESQANLQVAWDPFLKAMAEQTGYEVKAFFAPEYAGIIEGMRFGKVDLAWYGNKSAMEAVDRAGGEIFAQSVDVSGNPGYWSLLVAHKDSGLTYEDVLKCSGDLDFGNGDPNSTSGFLVPSYYVFAQNNIEAKDCFKNVTNAKHEANLFSVANKQVDVATNNTESLGRFKANQPEMAANVVEIWRSPLIPSDPIVWRKDLEQADKDKILAFFMSYGRIGSEEDVKAARDVLAGLDWAPFRPSSDAQLFPIRQLQLFRDKLKAQNDDKMAAADRDAKVAEIDAQLEELSRLASEVPQL